MNDTLSEEDSDRGFGKFGSMWLNDPIWGVLVGMGLCRLELFSDDLVDFLFDVLGNCPHVTTIKEVSRCYVATVASVHVCSVPIFLQVTTLRASFHVTTVWIILESVHLSLTASDYGTAIDEAEDEATV